jgi:hypothetical protein
VRRGAQRTARAAAMGSLSLVLWEKASGAWAGAGLASLAAL